MERGGARRVPAAARTDLGVLRRAGWRASGERAEESTAYPGIVEVWQPIFLMVNRVGRPQSLSIMSQRREPKPGMTKQGVRDLNHTVPKADPLALETTSPLGDDAPATAPEAAPPLEP